MKRIQIAVRDFALPVPRTGSIEVHSGYNYLPQSGDEVHQAAQLQRASANPAYRAEAKISHSFERDGYVFNVSGRIDGLVETDPPCIEEIKTAFDVYELYEKLRSKPDHPYCLQLLTYGYMYAIQNSCEPSCTFHLVSYATGDSLDLPVRFDQQSYMEWLDKRLDELVREAQRRELDADRKQDVAREMVFPFEKPRRGQLELIDTIRRTLTSNDALMLQAPTGIGKTAGVVFPVLQDALQRGQKLVYVTPKNSQHQVAEDAVRRIQSDGSDVRTLTLTAKSKVCFKGEPICNPEFCQYAKDYYAKVFQHDLVEKAAAHNNMTVEVFAQIGEQYEVCPFELSIDTIDRADVVIGDYNYVFAPRGLLGRLTSSAFGQREKPNLVIDEAHNLPARAADYYSPILSTSALSQCKERLESLPLDLRFEAFALMNSCLATIAKLAPEGDARQCKIEIAPEPFEKVEEQLSRFMHRYLQVVPTPKPGDPVVGLCRQWSEFTSSLHDVGEQYFSTFTRDGLSQTLKVTCCDASQQLSLCLKEFEHVVAFSATLKPFEYYQKLCGFEEDKVQAVEFASPFPEENRKLLIIPQVSTKYTDRARNCAKIAQAISKITALRHGNYFVFFPSFAFMRQVSELVELPHFNVLHQQPGMSGADVNKFIATLREGSQPTVIFAVQGGVFSEGVDYPGEMLIGAIIVGPALPGFDLERELLREYYEKKFGQGFDYAYTYPAMARVIQAAGRVIRSETDKGLIVLMDRRFTNSTYAGTMPGDWYDKSVSELVSSSITKDIDQFWSKGGVLELA